MILIILLLPLLLGGCLASNFAEVVKARGDDPNPNCLVLNAPMYGSLAVGRGSPEVNVAITPGSCIMEGNNVTNVKVPVGTLGVTPLTPAPQLQRLPAPRSMAPPSGGFDVDAVGEAMSSRAAPGPSDGGAAVDWLLRAR